MQVQKARYGSPREAVLWLLNQPGVFEDKYDDVITIKNPSFEVSGLSLRKLGCLDYLKRHCHVVLGTDKHGRIQATIEGAKKLL